MQNYFCILNTDNNRNQGLKYGCTDERPDEVVRIIERCRLSNRAYRLKFAWGDTKTGQDWGEAYDVAGYIGKSTGSRPIPLLVNNARSMGGVALSDAIVKISMAKGGQVLWQHPNYQPPRQ